MNRSPLALSTIALAALLAACGETPPASPGAWPQWRGPGGVGVAEGGRMPVNWTAGGPGVLWRTELPGEGNSSPIASGARVFVTSARTVEDHRVERLALAVDLATGELLWETVVATDRREHKSPHNTFAAPTPATDGRAVYAFFGGILGAIDLDGKLLWVNEVDPAYADESHYGVGSSPVVIGDAVIVARDRETTEGAGWLAAFDREHGTELWRNTWTDTCCSYATPFALVRPTSTELLFVHAGAIVSYDPETGKTLWKHPLPFNQPVTGPVIHDDLLVVFSGADRVRHGAVLRLSGSRENTRIETLWETAKTIPQASSPVLYNGLIYTVTEVGAMTCYDALTGKIQWRRRLPRGGYLASLLAGDGKIYIHNTLGVTTVLDATPASELLAQNDIGEPGNASPAWADPCLLLRTASALVCITAAEPPAREPEGPSPQQAS